MKSQSCRAKGRRLQQRVAQSIVEAFPHLEADDAVSTSSGANGVDVRMSPLAQRTIPVAVECKNQERLNIWACLEQTVKNCPPGMDPCLIFSRNRAATYAVLPWETVLALYQARYRMSEAGMRGGLPDELPEGSPGGAPDAAALPPRLAELLAELAQWAALPAADGRGADGLGGGRSDGLPDGDE